MSTYRVAIVMRTPYNPNKWDWDELIASEEGEQVLAVTVAEVDDSEPTLSWSDLANMTHERQVALFGWCSCEDSEAPYDDCPKPEYNCHWCDTPTWNGAGHYQEEMGYDHPQGEDRICTKCFTKWESEQA